eukprot:15483649-Alexandrium_andersonii.AAC.1
MIPSAIRAILCFWSARALLIGTCGIASGIRSSNCAGPGTTRTWYPMLARGAFCAAARAESDGGNE